MLEHEKAQNKLEFVNKKIGNHYEIQKINRHYSDRIVFIIALLYITSDK